MQPGMRRALRIDRTWDGLAAGEDEIVLLTLSCGAREVAIEIDAPYHGDPAPALPAGRCDRLWEFEVVELFLVGRGERYLELELGPHGHWLALLLAGPRNVVDAEVPLRFRARRGGARWSGKATVSRARLPPSIERWNAFAIHGPAQHRRHLAAWPLPGPRPDFHRIERYPSF